tara:strand:+ start:289 stop:555 length:267 start_codon:yes stop_codon:yes gene_type:complete
MSVAIDFERTLLQLLKDDKKEKEDNVSISEIKSEMGKNKEVNDIEYSDDDRKNCFEKQEFTIAPAVSLFAGICIGVGLASRSLITQWK